jgi:hypothetical protein
MKEKFAVRDPVARLDEIVAELGRLYAKADHLYAEADHLIDGYVDDLTHTHITVPFARRTDFDLN